MMFFDPMYLVFMLPALALGLYAQMKVKSAYGKFSRVRNLSGMSGAEAAAHMLSGMGIRIVGTSEQAKQTSDAVAIERTRGFLSDHYDPNERVLRLSDQVYGGQSIASVGIACHEAGHALQHAHGYAPLGLRTALVPTAQFGSWLAVPLILLGFFFSKTLILVGIALFTVIVLFQLVTLPVEFNASRRAKRALRDLGIVQGREEQRGVAAVLNAAALTYVAAAVSAIMTLLYYVLILYGGQRD